MRVIAGSLSGRNFESPHGHRTHPMSDRVRGALFNVLGDIEGLTVLDAFSGSGALSFEAISRGAKGAVAIESDRQAQNAIAQNVKQLRLNYSVKLIKASANAWLQTSDSEQFDIVLCDPPYDDLQVALLRKLTELVKPGGIFVLSWPGGEKPLVLPDLELLSQHSYGDAQLIFWRG